jgi:DNA polymerase elongation subunit (family B)
MQEPSEAGEGTPSEAGRGTPSEARATERAEGVLTFPERTSLYPEEGVPHGVMTAAKALSSIPRRSELIRPSYMPDAKSQHLVFFLQQTEVLPRRHVRPRQIDRANLDPTLARNSWAAPPGEDDDAADDGFWDAGQQDAGAALGGEEEFAPVDREKERELRDRRREDVVVLSGVTQEGVSIAVAVQHWRPAFWLMPSPDMARQDPDLAMLRELVKHLAGGVVSVEVQRRPCTYGYHPDPSSPGERASTPFLHVRCPSQSSLRWLCNQLERLLVRKESVEAVLKGGGAPGANAMKQTLVGRALASCMRLGGATIEEGDRLRPEFKFMDERELPPASWVVVQMGKYRLLQPWDPAFSFRTINAIVDEAKHVRPMETLLDDGERTARYLQAHSPLPLPDRNLIPPSLFAYADIESRSADANEFPEPTNPASPCYMVGISFVWAFGLPPCLTRLPEETAADWLGARRQELESRQQQEQASTESSVLERRAERLRLRRDRVVRYSRRDDVKQMLGTAEVEAMNSDDESEGEGPALVRAREATRKQADAELSRLSAMASGRQWSRSADASGPGAMQSYPCLRLLLVLGSCEPIPGAVVVCFPKTAAGEVAMLQWLRSFLFGVMDVDGIRGYNWIGFDTRYIVRRAELYGVVDSALRWSHIPARPPSYDSRGEVTLAIAKGIFRMVRLHYTNTVDMMIYMRQQLDLSSYKLEAIAEHFNLQGKHPIKPEHIFAAYSGTADERAVVGAYCLRDCDVLADIARASQFEVTLMQFARIMQTQCETMWTSGQQIRVVHQLIWQAHRQGFVVDGLFRDRSGEDRALRDLASGKSFSGGFVMKPAVAHYVTPTATLDFKSLYPSIMISHKLCFSTALLHPYDSPDWVERIRQAGREVLCIDTESGSFHYVQHPVNLIPNMEWTLWQSRQAIKKEMKKTRDPLVVAVLDAKQLAVKVSMNSTFGVTGAEHAMLGMKRIAASITHIGRTTVQAARSLADSLSAATNLTVTVPTGPDQPASLTIPVLDAGAALRTVYGDTDSIMVNLPGRLHPDAVRWAQEYIRRLLGEEDAAWADNLARLRVLPGQLSLDEQMRDPATAPLAAATLLLVCRYVGQVITDALNAHYRAPMEIEFEEVASQAIFLAPKMYTKNVVEDLGDPVISKLARGGKIGKLKVAGIAAKRRDRSLLTKRVQKGVASALVHSGDMPRAIQLVRRWVTRLALNEIRIEDFVITTELKNPNERIGQAVQPHVAVAWALEKACRGSEPVRGERVPWVLVRSADVSRLVPPTSKRTTGMDLPLPRTLSESDFGQVTLEALAQRVVHCRIAPTIPPQHQVLWFADRELRHLPPTTKLGELGIKPGHRITVSNEANPSAARVEFRVRLEDGSGGPSSHGSDDEDEDDAHGDSPAKKARVGLMDMMLFHAREMTNAERANLGKRRVSADKSASGLSAFARHPSEITSLQAEIDGRRYMDHIRSALEILLSTTRPDLWEQINRVIRLADPVIDVTQGKPRQGTLAGFFRKTK